MPVTSKTLSAATLSVGYITAGTLILIWSSVYYLYQLNHGELTAETRYWCYGFMLTGITIAVIGVLLGRIGAAARPAEVAAPEAGAPAGAPVPAAGQVVAQNGAAVAPAAVMPAVAPMVPGVPNPNGATAPAPAAAPAVPPR